MSAATIRFRHDGMKVCEGPVIHECPFVAGMERALNGSRSFYRIDGKLWMQTALAVCRHTNVVTVAVVSCSPAFVLRESLRRAGLTPKPPGA